MLLLHILIAILAFLSPLSATVSTTRGRRSSPTYCSIPRLFIQFGNLYSTCTFSYLPSADNKTVDLFAYDEHCDEIGHATGVGTNRNYGFRTHLKETITLSFDTNKGAEALVPRYWYQGRSFDGALGYRTKCFQGGYENGGRANCQSMFDCEVSINITGNMGTWSMKTH